jgi:N-acetylmuramoyl-L-alanine amidase
MAYSDKDVAALARIVYWEARGECDEGQIAVANVVINRVKDRRWPDTIEKVIAQKAQFTPYGNDRYFKAKIPEHFYDIARSALEGAKVIPDDYVYFSVGRQGRFA